jgi:hypothetical protein
MGADAKLTAGLFVPSPQSSFAAPVGPAFTGRHGVGGIPTFFFPRKEPFDPNRYAVDPYPSWDATMPRGRLDEIKHAGFDFLRLVIDPGPLLQSEGDVFERRISELRGAINSSLAAGLKVLVDVHVQNHPVWGYLQITAGFDHAAFKRYIEVMRALGGLISAFSPQSVALEIFNEPPPPCRWSDRPDWPQQLDVIYDVARRAAPDSTLFISGSCWASIEGLLRLDGSRFDQNTVFVIHYYEPFVFTHQGFWGSNSKFVEYVSRLSYPPNPTALEEVLRTVEGRIRVVPNISDDDRAELMRDAKINLYRYFNNWNGATNIYRRFTEVKKWADKYGIKPNRILLGEFGVMKDVYGYTGANPPDRIRWLSDVRTTAEKFGYSWCVHALTGPMGIIARDRDGRLDSGILGALGLDSS